MISKEALAAWVQTLAPGSSVAVDDGGNTLLEIREDGLQSEAYLEVGGYLLMEDISLCSTCAQPVVSADPYYATPCGTFCAECMETKHGVDCEICRSEFNLGNCKHASL